MEPCPYYRVQYLPSVETGYLNCAQAPDAIPAKSHLDFAMQINVPPRGDAPADLGGTNDLLWQLGGEGAEGETVTTPVKLTMTTPAPDQACPLGGQPGNLSKVGSGFIASWAVFSGRPDPTWRLTDEEATDLRALLRTTKRGIHRYGPSNIGDFAIQADRPASVRFFQALGLTHVIGIARESRIGRFLAETSGCDPGAMPTASDD